MTRDFPLPTEQSTFPGLPALPPEELHLRRERAFLVLAGLFLGTLTMLNILGITRFIDLSFTVLGVHIPMPLAVGVLPYPVTFLCTDLLSEFFGSRRTNSVVTVGLLLNGWVVLILWLGGALPGVEGDAPDGVFFQVRDLAFGAITASMVAYLVAQYVDVRLFHWWKEKTHGRHLWLRNNGSTLVSQLIDAVAVVLVTHYLSRALPIDPSNAVVPQLLVFVGANYTFKLVAALLDTGPFYLGVHLLRRYLRLHTGEGAGQAA